MTRRLRPAATALPLLLCLFGVARPAPAQEALVLSGGGARGVAHIGALVGLEQRGYDPDLVVGNSMGAIVGALYAAGYEPERLWGMLLTTDWSDLFMPEPRVLGPDRAVRYPMLRLGVDFGPLELTRGFVADWRVNRLLVRLLFDAGARSRGDFDRLPRRFRAVTADFLTGEQVVLAGGDLALAVRASMAAPAFFSPVHLEGRLLADGGIANYLPISVARELDAARIVAVDVSRPPPELGRTDPLALAGRALGLLQRNALPDSVADVLVDPDIPPSYSAVQFSDDVASLLRIGYDAAIAAPPAPRPHARAHLPAAAPETFGALRIDGADAALAALARSALADVVAGPYRPGLLLARIDRLYATGLVNGVWPRVEGAGPAPTLVLRLDPTPRLGLAGAAGYDNDRGARVWGEAERRAGALGAPFGLALAGSVGALDRWASLSARRYSLLRAGMAWTAGAHYRQADQRLYEGGDEVGQLEVRRAGGWLGVDFAHAFPDWVLSALVRAEHVDLEAGAAGLAVGPLLRLGAAEAGSRVVGVTPHAEAEVRFGEIAYRRVAATGSLDPALGRVRAAIVLDLEWTDGAAPLDVRPALGNRVRVPGFEWGEERGVASAVGGVDVAYPIPGQGYLRLRLRAGAAPDDVRGFDSSRAWAGGAGLHGVWATPLGALVVGAGANTRGRARVDIALGADF